MFSRCLPSALVVASLSLVLAACGREEQGDPRSEVPLVRAAVAKPLAQDSRSFSGVVVARTQSDLGFRVTGKIVERLVDSGEAVKQGQPLMRIDPTDLRLTRSALEEAVRAARARATQTAADEERYRDLVAAGAVSASVYDQLKAAADASLAQLNAAEAQANVARNETGYAVLHADADGIVMETLGEPGQVVAAGQTVVRLARSGPREARVDLPETLRPPLGSVAQATLYGGKGTSAPARLRQLSNAADAQTRTFEARYVLEGAAANAPLGSTVTVRLSGASSSSAFSVPLAALHDEGKGPGVWVISGEPLKVTWRAVQLAEVTDETARLRSGLEKGERFVALGAHLLHDGEQVRVLAGHVGSAQ